MLLGVIFKQATFKRSVHAILVFFSLSWIYVNISLLVPQKNSDRVSVEQEFKKTNMIMWPNIYWIWIYMNCGGKTEMHRVWHFCKNAKTEIISLRALKMVVPICVKLDSVLLPAFNTRIVWSWMWWRKWDVLFQTHFLSWLWKAVSRNSLVRQCEDIPLFRVFIYCSHVAEIWFFLKVQSPNL